MKLVMLFLTCIAVIVGIHVYEEYRCSAAGLTMNLEVYYNVEQGCWGRLKNYDDSPWHLINFSIGRG